MKTIKQQNQEYLDNWPKTKTLKVIKVPELAPKVSLQFQWRDELNRRCSQFICKGITLREANDIAEAINKELNK
jgi:hypothetical protein